MKKMLIDDADAVDDDADDAWGGVPLPQGFSCEGPSWGLKAMVLSNVLLSYCVFNDFEASGEAPPPPRPSVPSLGPCTLKPWVTMCTNQKTNVRA